MMAIEDNDPQSERQDDKPPKRARKAPATKAKAKAGSADRAKGDPAGSPATDAMPFNLVIVAQGGRLKHEALLLAASLQRNAPRQAARFFIAEPMPGHRWPEDPRIKDPAARALLEEMGARFIQFESHHFGANYPYGNKIECLRALPKGEPFLFLDTDTLILGAIDRIPFDFGRPSASMRVEGTWPEPQPYFASYEAIWKSLYDRFDLDFEASLDRSWPAEYWRRYMYFNAGWFFGACPHEFGRRFQDYALAIRNDPGEMLAAQSLDPWLDQVALPLVISSLGGGRPGPELAGLDGDITCHYRALPLLYAREDDRVLDLLEQIAEDKEIRNHLREWDAARKLIFQNKGRQKIRPLFDRQDLPVREAFIRNAIRREGWWMR